MKDDDRIDLSASSDKGSDDLPRDEILSDYIDRLNRGESLNPDLILAAYPTIGPEIVEQLEAYQGLCNSEPTEPLGTLGDYTLRRQIGRGGMGVVYEAWENSMDRAVALKVLPAGIAADDRSFQRFMQEAKTAGKLSHPNVVPVYFTGMKEQTPFYAMEFVDGDTLAQILARIRDAETETETPFGPKDQGDYFIRLARAFADVADGLQHAHSKGVTHRDIKPSNLILDGEGRLRILDFGLARLEGQESLTLSGDVMGTPLYMSPEQARRKKIPVDHRTDVYSLGATMYEVLTGLPPFKGKDHADTLSQIIEREPVDPRKINPRVPNDLETIVLKCIRKEVGDRYGTAEALVQDLRRFVRGDSVEARPQSTAERIRRQLLRKRRMLLRWAVVGLLLCVCSLLFSNYWNEAARIRNESYERAVVAQWLTFLRVKTLLPSGATNVGSRSREVELQHLLSPQDLETLGAGTNSAERAAGELVRQAEAIPARFEAHFYLGRGLLLLGKRAEARLALKRALDRRPGFVPAVLYLKEAEGEGESREASARGDDRPWQEVWRTAHRAIREGHWAEAAGAYTELIEIEKQEKEQGGLFVGSEIDLRLGRALVSLEDRNRYWDALTDLVVVRERWGDLVEPALLLGKTYYLLGNEEKAETTFQEVYEACRDRDQRLEADEAASWIAAVYRSLGEREHTIAWAGRLTEPSRRERLLAVFYGQFGELDKALRAVDNARQIDPNDPMAPFIRALLAFMSGKRSDPARSETTDKMLLECERMIDLQPDFALAYAVLAGTRAARGESEKAVEACRRALEILPDNRYALELVSVLLSAQGKILELKALHDWVRRETTANLSPRLKAVLVGYEGVFHAVLDGKVDQALEGYLEAYSLDPTFYWPIRNAAFLHFDRGEYNLAAELFSQAIANPALRTDAQKAYHGLVCALERQGRFGDAVRACCRAIASNARDPKAHENLLRILRRKEGELPSSDLDGLVDSLEHLTHSGPLDSRITSTLAFLRLRVPSVSDPKRARELITGVIEATSRRDADALSILAEAEHTDGSLSRAVLTLEEAVKLPKTRVDHADLLAAYRRNQLPDLVSYASVDAALNGLPNDRENDRRIMSEFLGAASGEHVERCRKYLEGRILQRTRQPEEAAVQFKAIVAEGGIESEPHLRLAECLGDAGDREAARNVLERSLVMPLPEKKKLWNRWLILVLEDPESEFHGFINSTLELEKGKGVSRYPADIRWLLDRFLAGDSLRINCGGAGGYTDGSGRAWSSDRFYRGGLSRQRKLPVVATQDEPLYQSHRAFFAGELRSGYSIPVPPDVYSVVLHCWETKLECAGESAEVLIEGDKVRALENCGHPFQLRVEAKEHTFEIAVSDGILDIELRSKTGPARISAIEIGSLP